MSEANLEQFREVTPAGRFTLQNSSLLKVRLENDRVQAKLGSMVAYQGGVRFEHQSGGLGRFFKKAMTGEGVKLMACEGTGDLFLAQDARKIMVLDLNDERMTVNGDSILAFEGNVDWDIRRVEVSSGTPRGRPLQRRPRRHRQGRPHQPRRARAARYLDAHLRRPRVGDSLERRREDQRPLGCLV